MPRFRTLLAKALCLGKVVTSVELARGADNAVATNENQHTFSVSDFGARGDGATLDTAAINAAIEACSTKGGGQVLFPPGRYLSGTVHLRSRITLFLAPGAALVGSTNLAHYQQPAVPSFMPEASWGKWHRALVVGENVEDVAIAGQGIIDGNKVFDPAGEERMRGPHTIALVNCRRVTLRDISIQDSANYAIFFQVSDQVELRNLKITGGWDGVHFRGAPDHPCQDVSILGCQFFTGDDSIAGRYWDNALISGCILKSACNGIRLIGPATHLIINDCLFYGPGLQPHRSSKRKNMLSGIILQPGAWDKTEGPLDDVLLANNTMRGVASPVTIWTRGNNPIHHVTVAGLNATGVYRSALSVESWADAPIKSVVIRDAHVEFTGGGQAEQATHPLSGPGVDARPLPAWGLYARNVESLVLEDVRLSLSDDDLRPVIMADHVQHLNVDSLAFTPVHGITNTLVTTNVGKLTLRNTDLH